MSAMSETLRLHVYMARCGVASRRKCEEYILEGRVSVNGKRAEIGSKVSPGDRVFFDRKPLRLESGQAYLAVNKPRGYLCANEDAQGRPLVADLLRRVPFRLFHVGRLDMQSSGLIFYTNDGEFAKQVSHPSSAIEKEYRVECGQDVPEEMLQQYQAGITVQGERYRLKRYRFRSARSLSLTLIEGKNREIRQVFEHFRIPLRSIHRVRIGCVTEEGIPSGRYRRLEPAEIEWFRKRRKG
jgi:23S rRNA pseudouridine2605 synthase